MCGLEIWFVRVGLRVIPVQLGVGAPNFIAISIYENRCTSIYQSFADHQSNVMLKVQFTHNARQHGSAAH